MHFSTLILAAVTGITAVAGRACVPRAAPSTWVHPGILMNQTQLDTMRDHVAAKTEPWYSAYKVLLGGTYANMSRTPSPVPMVECGGYSIPDVGCLDERVNAMSAYAMSLLWYITGNQTYADKSMEYMDAWSGTVGGHNNSNAPLQSGWVGSVWARTAEIIRYSDAGWSDTLIKRFATMLTDVYLPEVIGGALNYSGNWELVMMEAAISIAIFTEDADAYTTAMTKFLARVPTYIYLESDGDLPVVPAGSKYQTDAEIIAFWYDQTTFVNGLAQETCRDMEHTGYGIASISHVAETSRIQGRDLFIEEVGERLRYGLEFHTQYSLVSTPDWLCNGSLSLTLVNVTEIGHSELVDRLGYDLPYLSQYTLKQRPGGAHTLFVSWETLTHGMLP